MLLPAPAISHRLQFTGTPLSILFSFIGRGAICQLLCTQHTCAAGAGTSEVQWRIRMDILRGQKRFIHTYSKVGSRELMLHEKERDQELQRNWQVNRGPWTLQTAGLEVSDWGKEFSHLYRWKQGGCFCAPASNNGLWIMTKSSHPWGAWAVFQRVPSKALHQLWRSKRRKWCDKQDAPQAYFENSL